MALKALIFDVDGTLAETEELHRQAFNQAFAEAGHAWHWDAPLYRQLLRVTGGRERMGHFLDVSHIDLPDRENAIAALHVRKNAVYAQLVASGACALRPGVERLICSAHAHGIALAIATTTSRANVTALLAATPLADATFSAIVTAEDVARKKPDPEAYNIALQRLDLAPAECLAFEDSENGLRAARAAGIQTVITPGYYTNDGDFSGCALLIPDLMHHTATGATVDLALLAALI